MIISTAVTKIKIQIKIPPKNCWALMTSGIQQKRKEKVGISIRKPVSQSREDAVN